MGSRLVLFSMWIAIGGCGGGPGAGSDGGSRMDSGAHACSGAACCGNGALDTGEQCDDGNGVAFDGCETDCTFTCTNDTRCDDSEPCNGRETCNLVTHICAPGAPLADGVVCNSGAIANGACRNQMCVGSACGNSQVDTGEDCDDGNSDDADGCTIACRFTCTGTTCDDLDRCTSGDQCTATASGRVCRGTAIADNMACDGTGEPTPCFCVGGRALQCLAPSHCNDLDACTLDECSVTGTCIHSPMPNGTACDDGNACTRTDACTAGACMGSNPVVCTALDQCHDVGVCDPTSGNCSAPIRPFGTACDDGAPCTFTDVCQLDGSCRGTTITCTSDPGTCGARRMCNGTASCAVSWPTVACDDGAPCTYNDHCDGAGSCTGGGSVSCVSDSCFTRTCNGTATCAVSVRTGSPCTDSNGCVSTCASSGACTTRPTICDKTGCRCG